jgi:diguanylate cyclase (GGDEF)-like protein
MKTLKYVAVVFLPLFFLVLLLIVQSSVSLRSAASSLSVPVAVEALQPAFMKTLTVYGVILFAVFGIIQTVLVYFFFKKPQAAFSREINEKLELVQKPEDEKVYDKVLELYKSVITDPKTGAVLFKYFMTMLDKEMVRADRYKLPFSILKITLKSKGDFDESFKKAGAIIISVLRTIDIISINEHKEFVILLPNTKKANGDMAVRRIFRRVQQVQETSGASFSLSVGIATYADDGITTDVLLGRADANLQKAKILGENKVVF